MSDQTQLTAQLKKQIADQLQDCCNKNHLPRVQNFISTSEGMERAETLLFEMCASDGIAVQTAMSQLESELANEQYHI